MQAYAYRGLPAQWGWLQSRLQIQAYVVVYLEVEEVSKNVCIDKIECIYTDSDDNHQL